MAGPVASGSRESCTSGALAAKKSRIQGQSQGRVGDRQSGDATGCGGRIMGYVRSPGPAIGADYLVKHWRVCWVGLQNVFRKSPVTGKYLLVRYSLSLFVRLIDNNIVYRDHSDIAVLQVMLKTQIHPSLSFVIKYLYPINYWITLFMFFNDVYLYQCAWLF